jgi:M-phase inducer tyrosine phosphatase
MSRLGTVEQELTDNNRAEHIRRQDRRANEAVYPKLTYPEVYILDGGYHSFFKTHNTRCYPQNYVEMDAEGHEATCEREMEKLRRRGKLNRAVTYAFGQADTQMEDSPTASGRTASFDTGSRPFPDHRRNLNRRMVSY